MRYTGGMTNPVDPNIVNEINAMALKFAGLSPTEWQSLQQQLDVATVKTDGVSFEAYMSFARLMMYEPSVGTVEPAEHHQDWIHNSIEHNRILILAPPESAKTTIMSVLFTAWWIGNHPATQSMVCSVSDDQAQKIVGLIAAYIEHHPAWKLMFPDIVPDKKRGWGFDKGFFVKRRDIPYGSWMQERGARRDPTLLGVGYQNRSIIGKRVDGLFVVDDIMDETNTISEAELEKAKAIFRKTIASRVTKEGKMVVIGTPWREDDVYAYATATGLYRTFITPAWTGEGDKRVSYWPSQWPIPRLEDKQKEVGTQDFGLMYLMDLSARKGTVLKEEWLHPYVRAFDIDAMWPLFYGIDFAVTSADLGTRTGRRRRTNRSNFALAKIRAAPFGLILVDGWAGTISLYEAIEKLKSWIAVDRPKKTQVESWGTGELFLQMLIREGLTVHGYKDTKDKVTRFQRMAVHFEIGRLRMSESDTPFLNLFRNEWVGFPDFPTNDTLDAVACAIDAAGVNMYAGQRVIQELDNRPVTEQMPWGGTWGMPSSKFQGNK